MQVNQIIELDEKEKALLKVIIETRISKEADSLLFSTSLISKYLGLEKLNNNQKHEAITDALVNIMSIPALVGDKRILVINGWQLGNKGALIEFSDDFMSNLDEACEYLLTYVCNPNKVSFIVH